jgi:hypothetical protein
VGVGVGVAGTGEAPGFARLVVASCATGLEAGWIVMKFCPGVKVYGGSHRPEIPGKQLCQAVLTVSTSVGSDRVGEQRLYEAVKVSY